MNPMGKQPEYVVAYDIEYMDDGERRCEMVKAPTPQLAIEKLISYRGPRIEILSYPKYHRGCNFRYLIWKRYEEMEKGIPHQEERPVYYS